MPEPAERPHPSIRALTAAITGAVLDAAAVLMPVECAGCGAPDRAICPVCRRALAAAPRPVERDGVSGWVALDYDGIARRVIAAYKDGGRTDVAGALAPALARVVRLALAEVPSAPPTAPWGIGIVTVPSSPAAAAARGYRPVERLLAGAGIRPARVLRATRDRRDQAGLGLAEREANLRGSLAARARLAGRRFLFVDDVLTTGATAREATRAIQAAGGVVVGAAFLAETARRRPPGEREAIAP